MSHLCHISPVAPPSHHVRPVASVPVSEGRCRRHSSPRRGRPQPASPRTTGPPGRWQPQSAAALCLGPEGVAGEATGCAKSHELLRRISEDFGSEKLGVWLPTETHTGISNMSQISLNQKTVSTGLGSHSCEPITTSSTFKPIPSQESAIFVDLLHALGVHLQQASDSSDVAFFRSLQDVSASKRPNWQSKVYSVDQS